jgi:hypothetical protein
MRLFWIDFPPLALDWRWFSLYNTFSSRACVRVLIELSRRVGITTYMCLSELSRLLKNGYRQSLLYSFFEDVRFSLFFNWFCCGQTTTKNRLFPTHFHFGRVFPRHFANHILRYFNLPCILLPDGSPFNIIARVVHFTFVYQLTVWLRLNCPI